MTAELYAAVLRFDSEPTPDNRAAVLDLIEQPGQLTDPERRTLRRDLLRKATQRPTGGRP